MIYRLLFRLFLRRTDAERAHVIAGRLLRAVTAPAPLRAALRALLGPRDTRLRVGALGLSFPSPLGVAAGLDKEATWFEALAALGFGFVEVGTVTAVAQPGNERPRVFRLPRDRALVNSMGFPNPGAAAVARRLRSRARGVIVGVNVGKSRAVALGDAGADHRAAVAAVAGVADYLVINVSSPNTPGLRELQAVERLGPLVDEVREELRRGDAAIPLLVKIDPDIDDAQIDAICDLCLEHGVDGIVAVNTTTGRDGLSAGDGESAAGRPGGLSGAPLAPRALEVLRRLRARAGDRLVLVSAGGVQSADDAWERILAGATLVQAYTGFVYGGPLFAWRVNRGLAARTRAAGAASIQELVGSEAEAGPG